MSLLKGKTAIVTGSARGMGAAIALALAKEGADVVINYVAPSSKSVAEKVAAGVEAHGSQALVVQADLSSPEDLNSLVAKAVERFGRIDILVNNAGTVEQQMIGGITLESYQYTLDINLRPVVFLSQAVIPYMTQGGRIINVTSTVARTGNAGLAAYAASKAGAEGATRVLATELRDKGICVNSVNPGPVDTDMFRGFSKEAQEGIRKTVGVAEPADIANVVTFLAGPNSRWITGSTISANNGMILN